MGNTIYQNGSLKTVLFDGGYLEGGKFFFYLQDHLGNNRVVADAAGNANKENVHIGGKTYIDKYDFNMDGRMLRDFATWVGRPGGEKDGTDFFIYGYRQATVPVKN